MPEGGQYVCWNCGLRQGDPDAPELPSDLCPSCRPQRERIIDQRVDRLFERFPDEPDEDGWA